MTEISGRTPSQTVGPYFAIWLTRDLITPRLVDPTDPRAIRIHGTLFDGAGEPVPDGMVEIWQANAAGRYADPADDRAELALEDGFLGFGRSGTLDGGRFEFVTVKPGRVPWPGGGLQAPHLEVGVFARGLLKHAVTRVYFPDEVEANAADPVLAGMLEAERALAAAGARAGVVPADEASTIAEACVPDGYDWGKLLLEGRRVGNPAEPLVRALSSRVGEETARWVHLGATSQDIMDTAAMLVARRALGLVLDELSRVTSACATLARAHRDTPMAGRTLLQQAVPTTFGLKAASWLVAVLDARTRLVALRRDGLAAQLGGAAGTLAALGERALEIAALYAEELGLAEAAVPWHTNRVRIAELGAALDIASGVLAKIGLDAVLLAQTEVAEVHEGGEGGGSSTMPHKRNPVGATTTRACAGLARAHASVLGETLVQEHERAAGAWQAEWEALSGALAYTGGAAAALAGALEGLEVDVARMRANLDLTGGQVVAERIALLLSDRLGRAAARALVRDASLRASASGRSLGEELAELDTGLTGEELRAALDPSTYLGSAGALVDRALARYDSERDE